MLVNQFLSCRFISGMVNPIRPVSYTHLDVYKRQDAAEDQLALASGITGIYYLRHIRGVHQLFENIKLLFLILSHYHCLLYTSRCV